MRKINGDRDYEEKRKSVESSIKDFAEVLIRNRTGNIYNSSLEVMERPLLEAVLERTYGNQIRASKILGMNRNTLRNKIGRLGIDAGKWKSYF